MKWIITKKTYPVIVEREKDGEKIAVIVKTIAEYRILGIPLYKKALVMPPFYGYRYWDDFITRI